jgi:dephospho-CoA kinase
MWGAASADSVRVVGFTGMPGSGKSEAMEVAKARGHPVIRMGDLIWEEVDRQGLPRDARHVGQVANGLRETHGKDVWAKRTAERVREVASGQELVLIDGIRSQEEVETLRREIGQDFLLVAIHTDPDHRFERMIQRGRADDSKDPQVLKARDEREMTWGIARTIALADEMLVNDSTLETFRQRVTALLDRITER